MTIRETDLPGVLVVQTDVHRDDRGFFLETYSEAKYRGPAFGRRFVQDNASLSSRGVLRGLHLQNPNPQAKLVYVLDGEVFDVAVDVRMESPNFKRWHGEVLSAENGRQLLIPEGFAHGFCVLSETAIFAYKVTAPYSRNDELTIAWNDPEIGIEWPISTPILSERDVAAPKLSEINMLRLP